MKIKFLIAICISAVVLAATTLVGCGEPQPSQIKLVPQPSQIKLVPQAANMIVEIQVDNIINNPVLVAAYNNSSKSTDAPQTVQDAINKFTKQTGLNLLDFSQVLIFGDTNNMQNSDSSYMGFIAQGTFNETQLVQNIEDNTGKNVTTGNYKGNQLYTNINDRYSLAFFNNEMLVFGSEQAVKDCIDVNKGDAKPLSGTIIDMYDKLGQTSFRAAFTLTAGAKNILQTEIPDTSAILATTISNGDTLGLSLNVGLLDISLNLALHCYDVTSAQNARDTASGAINLVKDKTTPGLKTLLSEIQLNTSDVWTTASLKTNFLQLLSLSGASSNK